MILLESSSCHKKDDLMIIFIAGAHAVGKSTLCNAYIADNDCIHRNASQLISEGKIQNWGVDKKTESPIDNQIVLLQQLEKIRTLGADLLLDGHFVLINSKGEYIELSEDVFAEMKLDGVVLIECEDSKIEERFKLRGAELNYSPEKLRSFENMNAQKICSSLKIPLSILKEPSIGEFKAVIETFKK
ncbi:AAA family ATPase [Salmonella enterica subsp. enterica serovar Tees]|nr:AAA family ATPase [Salmonella enterica subsp. enterica serovar Tees]EBF8335989.1 AAA family ATPase [Salmonella enterica subsp. enterica serovar Tees]EBY6556464.1 AAA family ATPase [Salmonella enterica subsp. enterica serovar Tees]ECB6715226.1 AAA family ATPase [Salmonella enterica subsp. enterica serovar Tees]EDV2954342.1 AAA family ATPase [Salmonella enterica subsp. enterica]